MSNPHVHVSGPVKFKLKKCINPECGHEFRPTTNRQTYCCKPCRSSMHSARRNEQKQQQRKKLETLAQQRASHGGFAKAESGRRHGIDPCTTDREYTDEEREFMLAVEKYKRESKRPFPTLSEYLEILKGLGYKKAS